MNPDSWPQVKAVFASVLSIPPSQRAAFLDQACGRDASLRAEVEALLVANEGAESFLAEPALPLSPPSDPPRIAPGQMIGRYRVLSLLGSGGMGEVYLAEDPRLGRRVALKVLPRQLSHDPDRLRRLEREARTASRLAHPNVCVIYEIADTDDQRPFIAMEYVEGESLREVLERHRAAGSHMPPDEAVDVVLQVAAGLGAAHAAGIVHRDVKPENIMRRPDGLVKVLDFGVAKLSPIDSPGGPGTAGQTAPGTIVGTVQYMSPEQVRGLPLDPRTDGWSLGVVLFELLMGEPPFVGESPADVMVAILDRQPRRLRELVPELPVGLQEVVDRALSKDPEKRYSTMNEFASDLLSRRQAITSQASQSEASDHPYADTVPGLQVPRRRSRLITAAVSVAALLSAAGGLALWQNSRHPHAESADSTGPRVSGNSVAPTRRDTATIPRPIGVADTAKPQSSDTSAASKSTLAPRSRPNRAKSPRSQVTAPVPPRIGFLTVNAVPYGAVAIDGVEVGDTPIVTHQLPPGDHVIRITREGYRPESVSVTITAGNEVRLSRTLQPQP
jgi:serine/threonine protein kinase